MAAIPIILDTFKYFLFSVFTSMNYVYFQRTLFRSQFIKFNVFINANENKFNGRVNWSTDSQKKKV